MALPRNPDSAWLAASCLTATDSGALEDLLQFEAALSTVTSLLCFGFIAGLFQAHAHSTHLALHVDPANNTAAQLAMLLRHLLIGVVAGPLVGALAPPLIDRLVRSESLLLLLLLVAISLAFVAYGLGQTPAANTASWPCSPPASGCRTGATA